MHFITQISVIIILSSGCYLNTLSGTFVFDDAEAVLKNQDVRPETPLLHLFKNDFWGTPIRSNNSHKSYRPLSVLSYRFDAFLSGGSELNPYVFHAINVILYVCVSVLAFFVCRLFYNNELTDTAFLTAVLFCVHPVHVEVVAGIVGRADMLCTIFFFFALLSYSYGISDKRHYFVWMFVSIVFTTLSVFSKETGITVLGVFTIYDVMRKGKARSHLILRQFALFVLGLLILYLRFAIMDFSRPVFQPSDNPAAFSDKVLSRQPALYVLMLIFAFAGPHNYLYFVNALILVWPQWLCFDWSMGCIPLVENLVDVRVIAICLFWAAVITFIVKLAVKPLRNDKTLTLGLCFTAITFLPASNVLLKVGFVVAERALFLPSVGYCALVITGWKRLVITYPERKNLLKMALISLYVVFVARTVQRSREWLTERALFTSALEVCPDNAKVHYNIAKVAGDGGDLITAEREYRVALLLNDRYDQAMNNLANLLRDRKRFEEAEMLLRKAVETRPSFATAWMNLGIVLASVGKIKEAEDAYLEALVHRKKYADCYYNLGNLYLELKRHEEALSAWYQATRIKPTHTSAWSNTLVLLDSLGRFDEALEKGETALKANNDTASLHFTIANTLGKLEKWTDAEHHFLLAFGLNRTNALYRSNLGVLYHRWGKLKEAENMYREALTINPGMKTAKINLEKLLKKMGKIY